MPVGPVVLFLLLPPNRPPFFDVEAGRALALLLFFRRSPRRLSFFPISSFDGEKTETDRDPYRSVTWSVTLSPLVVQVDAKWKRAQFRLW